jgi:hypothetical protein
VDWKNKKLKVKQPKFPAIKESERLHPIVS